MLSALRVCRSKKKATLSSLLSTARTGGLARYAHSPPGRPGRAHRGNEENKERACEIDGRGACEGRREGRREGCDGGKGPARVC